MKKHKNKIIAAVVILAALAGAWFWGGNYNRGQYSGAAGEIQNAEQPIEIRNAEQSNEIRNAEFGMRNEVSPTLPVTASNINDGTGAAMAQGSGDRAQETMDAEQPNEIPNSPDSESIVPNSPNPQASEEPQPSMEISPETGKDKNETSQAPEGKPLPVEPEDMAAGDGSFTVTLTVRCATILDNMNLLDREKHELVPEDGIIFPVTTITAYEGESVFNVFQREMRRAGIHMTFRNTPIYNSAYIEAINNLYEFDVGELSGWMYSVNGWFPNYGCSRYQLMPGDEIVWHYSCDLGRDLGQSWITGWQLDD